MNEAISATIFTFLMIALIKVEGPTDSVEQQAACLRQLSETLVNLNTLEEGES